ncbi:MAG: tandem-95 repeat protein [Thermales bacterium]|nr:tandem-95 repeat protein [Thermales bacterium]
MLQMQLVWIVFGSPVNIPTNGTPTNVYDRLGNLAGVIAMNSNGTYNFTPETGFVGEVSIDYVTIDNDISPANALASLTIEVFAIDNPDINQAPDANNDNSTTEEDINVNGNVLSNDYDIDGDSLTVDSALVDLDGDGDVDDVIVLGTPTNVYGKDSGNNDVLAGELTLNIDGTWNFDPIPGFIGTVPAIYTAIDPVGLTDTANLNIEVIPVDNNNTFATDDTNSGQRGEELLGNLLDNDFDPEVDNQVVNSAADSSNNSLTIDGTTSNTLPSGGGLIIDTDGSYDYTPDPNFVGTEVVTYEVCDDGTPQACDTATLYLTSNQITPSLSSLKVATATNYNSPVEIGDTIDYQITVENDGNVVVSNIIITDTKLGGDITSNCVFPIDSATGLNPGEIATCMVSYTLTQDDINTGYVENTAIAAGEDPFGDPVTDTSDAGDESVETPDGLGGTNSDPADDPTVETVPQNPEIRLEKTAVFNDENGDGVSQVGETITYQFLVENTGNVNLTNVQVNDPLITVNGGSISVLVPGAIDDTTFSGTYSITQIDINARNYTNSATASGFSPLNVLVTDISDDPTDLSGNDDPTIILLIPNTTVAVNDVNQTPFGIPVSGNISTNDFDVNGDVQSIVSVTGYDQFGAPLNIPLDGTPTEIYTNTGDLAGVIEMNNDGTYTFTPETDFVGEVTLDYEIIDDNSAPITDTAILSIEVLNEDDPTTNQPPVAINDTGVTTPGNTINLDLINNDSDPENDVLSVTEVLVDLDGDGDVDDVLTLGVPTTIYGRDELNNVVVAGQLTVNVDGTYTYQSEPGFLGTVPAIYTIEDVEGLDDTATLEINVVSTTSNATFANDDVEIGESGEPLTGNVLDNDSDLEGDNQIVESAKDFQGNTLIFGLPNTLPSGGVITINMDGSFVYTPDPEFIGTEFY